MREFSFILLQGDICLKASIAVTFLGDLAGCRLFSLPVLCTNSKLLSEGAFPFRRSTCSANALLKNIHFV